MIQLYFDIFTALLFIIVPIFWAFCRIWDDFRKKDKKMDDQLNKIRDMLPESRSYGDALAEYHEAYNRITRDMIRRQEEIYRQRDQIIKNMPSNKKQPVHTPLSDDKDIFSINEQMKDV